MGVAYYIALDRDVEGVDIEMSGKALAAANEEDAHEEELTAALTSAGLPPLLAYFSQDPAEMLGLMFEIDPEDASPEQLAKIPPEKWFDAAEGIRVFDVLAAYVTGHRASINDADAVLADISDAKRIVSGAAARGVKWHLAVDY